MYVNAGLRVWVYMGSPRAHSTPDPFCATHIRIPTLTNPALGPTNLTQALTSATVPGTVALKNPPPTVQYLAVRHGLNDIRHAVVAPHEHIGIERVRRDMDRGDARG